MTSDTHFSANGTATDTDTDDRRDEHRPGHRMSEGEKTDPTELPVFPEDTLARGIIDWFTNRRVLAVLILVFAPMVGWVGFTMYADLTSPNYATATIYDENGDHLESVEGPVAATWRELHVGLSETESLDPGHGMFFLHDEEKDRAYVMREMAFPIDIIFIDAGGTITGIHHAELDPDGEPYTEYRGYGTYVLEVPYQWTAENNINVGNTVQIEWGPPRVRNGGGSTVVASVDDNHDHDSARNWIATETHRRLTSS
jgi:uncharacterized membrane protein (UPF0127 family)